MRRLALFLLAPLLTVACGKLYKVCTAVGCQGSLELSFEADSWADGDYQVTLDVGGDYTESCRFTIPLSEPNPQAGSSCWDPPTFDGTRLVVVMPTPMDDTLVEVDVAVLLDDALVHEETLAPEWGEPVYPNGEECDAGYGCLSAEATIEL